MYSETGEGDKLSSSTSAQPFRHFSLAEIQSATKEFDDELVIGRGGFGKVYKGHIRCEETSLVVAIKRLDSMSDQGAPEFKAEIEMLSKVRHCHLVSLIGYCDDNKEMILVYEYMPHGTLYDRLHKAESPLNWVQRLKIAIGAARGLDYLHTGVGTQHGIIHRDVKSSNILLDENWEAMISDFGLSIMGPINQQSSYVNASAKGTFGYLDPEYFYTDKLTRKTDVFAFGVVLFELLSGRLAVDKRYDDQRCLFVWAKNCVKERRFDQMVDSNIKGTVLPKCLRRFAQIADRCLHSRPKERPTMAEVVVSLQLLLELQKKSDNSAESSSTMGFTWKINKYFVSSTQGNSVTQDLKIFTCDELERAISGLQDDGYLGAGRYGRVYKGWVGRSFSPSKYKTGFPIAIKKLRFYIFKDLEKTKLDLKLLRVFSHPNLLKPIGYCLNDEDLILVYHFMQNQSLWHCLYNGTIARLPLVTKVKIVVGIARALVFLHKTQKEGGAFGTSIYESWLVRHNILLDDDFMPKLSDYDLVNIVYGRVALQDGVHESYFYHHNEPLELQSNLSGFTVVFTEVLIGDQISNMEELEKTNQLLIKDGIVDLPDSLSSFAKLCFEICNEEDSESKMLRVLNKFDTSMIGGIRIKDANHLEQVQESVAELAEMNLQEKGKQATEENKESKS